MTPRQPKKHAAPPQAVAERPKAIWDGTSPDTPTRVQENGAKESAIPYRFDLIDGSALAAVAQVLKEGADKYGEGNWELLPIQDHLNHLLMHAYAYLAGDTKDDHLSHIACRAIFALGVSLQ